MSDISMLRGVVHGKMIELDQDAGLPEGQAVTVFVQPLAQGGSVADGLKNSFGGWADDADALDEYLAWNRQQRKQSFLGRVSQLR